MGQKLGADPNALPLPDDVRWPYRVTGYTAIQSVLERRASRSPGSGWGALRRGIRLAAHPRALWDRAAGREDFHFPGTHALFEVAGGAPDLVHCHNLHGGYFDLGALTWLGRRVPTVLTLHDMWLLTGHCAYPLDCDRWSTGCGSCPDLTLHPAVRKDATAFNWQRKRDIYAQSRLAAAVPSRWLADQVKRSMLGPALSDLTVIPNGVDLSVFRPGDRAAARELLGLPHRSMVVLLTAGSRGSMWKDDQTLEALIGIAASNCGEPIVFAAPGRGQAFARGVRADVRRFEYIREQQVMARWYQAADVYIHASKADTFPTAVLESLACGTPVIATGVGGIAEQIRTDGEQTGILVPAADPTALARALDDLLADRHRREVLGRRAANDSRQRFDLERQADEYLAWYEQVRASWCAAA